MLRRVRAGWLRAGAALAAVVAAVLLWGMARAAISYVAWAGKNNVGDATSIALPRPAGVAAGDYLVAMVAQDGNGSFSTPSGWTLLRSSNGTRDPRLMIYGRFAAADDPASWSFSSDRKDTITGGIVALRGVDTTAPLAASGIQANNGVSSCTAPSVSPAVTDTLLLGVWGAKEASLTPPDTMTALPGANGGDVFVRAAYQALSVSGATGTRAAAMSDKKTCNGALLAFKPAAASTYTISGTVYEDPNYGGGAGRSRAAAAGVAVAGARVELYGSAGAFVSATNSAADGSYSFTALAAGAWHVRVASQSVRSTRSGSTAAQLGVLTWRANAASGSVVAVTDQVGGTVPGAADPGNGGSGTTIDTSSYAFSAGLTGTAHAVAAVTLGSADVGGVDFGFNFDTVTHTGASGQGSLAQAVANANALGGDATLAVAGRSAGVEHVVFMVANGSAAAGLRSAYSFFSGGVATITPTAPLVLSASLVVDAQTQPGWSADPVLEIAGGSLGAGQSCWQVDAGTATLRGLIVNRCPADGVRLGGGSAHGLQGNWIGLSASGGSGQGNGGAGIGVGGASGSTISGNRIEGNARGVSITSGSGHRISGNRFQGQQVLGIDLGADGVTANDGSAVDGTPNRGMDHPVFSTAALDTTQNTLRLVGQVGTGSGQAAFAGAQIEVYRSSAHASGYGEGLELLATLTADAAGRFDTTLAVASGALAVGDPITATATDAAGNTSEFGPSTATTEPESPLPSGFNAFETDTAALAVGGVIRTRIAGQAGTFAVAALDAAGTALHSGFSGTVALTWLDARDDSGPVSGSCRSSWVELGSAGSAVFDNAARVQVTLTPPASGTRVMRLKMSHSGASGSASGCSGDAFAVRPAQLTLAPSDADAASAGTTRALTNSAASGGVVHRAGRPFTAVAQALGADGTPATGYDGTPRPTVTACLLPAGCSAGALQAADTAAVAGAWRHDALRYAEVGVVALQLVDEHFADIDAADTPAATRRISSAVVSTGRFVPDSLELALATSGTLATANGACLAAGSGATFFGQGFGWATPPQVTVTARNADGQTTALWGGELMKLVPSGITPGLSASGSASLSTSFGGASVTALGAGQARVDAAGTDRFLLELPTGAVQPSVTPTWAWTLAVSDASEAGVAGNPTLTTSVQQTGVPFDRGAVFHSGRLALAPAHGDARSGVRALVQLQRWSSAGWITMTEDRGCVTVQPRHLVVANPSGVFTTAGACAAPLATDTPTRGGRAWLVLPATPGGAPGRLWLRLAGEAASGQACTAAGAVQPLAALGQPWLTGGVTGAGPGAWATWGSPNREPLLRREIW